MQVQVRHDANIQGGASLIASITATIESGLDAFAGEVHSVDVHVSDQNGPKTGSDAIRCTVEARVNGRPPQAVTHDGPTLGVALDVAVDKLARLLDHQLGRVRAKAGDRGEHGHR